MIRKISNHFSWFQVAHGSKRTRTTDTTTLRDRFRQKRLMIFVRFGVRSVRVRFELCANFVWTESEGTVSKQSGCTIRWHLHSVFRKMCQESLLAFMCFGSNTNNSRLQARSVFAVWQHTELQPQKLSRNLPRVNVAEARAM